LKGTPISKPVFAATSLLCRECGQQAACPNCSVSLTVHGGGRVVDCHYCGHHTRTPPACEACKGEYLRLTGYGTEKVVEVRNKQKRETEQKFFPGYVLVEMELTDDTWHLVRSTPKVTGFVGSGSKPVSLPDDQVEDILRQMEAGAEKPKPKSVFQRGDKVRVIDGPFVNFQGVVEDINPERGRMKVEVPVFGRPTPVELEYYQVERL
jgi:transcriptional antiterminator NusG